MKVYLEAIEKNPKVGEAPKVIRYDITHVEDIEPLVASVDEDKYLVVKHICRHEEGLPCYLEGVYANTTGPEGAGHYQHWGQERLPGPADNQ